MRQPSQLSWVAAALFLLVAGMILGNVVLLTGAGLVLVAALLSTALPPPDGVVVTRSLAKVTCWVGDALTMERRLTVRSGIGAIFVHDPLPQEAEVLRGSNLRVVWKWPGSRERDLSYEIRFSKRGLFTLEETGWESRGPFGANQGASGYSGPSFQISVAPRIHSITRLNAARTLSRSDRSLGYVAGAGVARDDFRELRPYAPGDPFKWINWKATARSVAMGSLPLVNEMDPDIQGAVWIFLDMADYMDVGVPLSSPLENTVEVSSALAQFYLSRGSAIGAYAYNAYGGGQLLVPDAGKHQLNRLVQMLAGLKPGPAEEGLLRAVERCKSFLYRLRPDIFIITRLDVHYLRPGESSDSFRRFKTAVTRLVSLGTLSSRRNPVRVVHIDPQEFPEASQGLSMARWETRLVAKDLRDTGVPVIEWEPTRRDFTSVFARHVETHG